MRVVIDITEAFLDAYDCALPEAVAHILTAVAWDAECWDHGLMRTPIPIHESVTVITGGPAVHGDGAVIGHYWVEQ